MYLSPFASEKVSNCQTSLNLYFLAFFLLIDPIIFVIDFWCAAECPTMDSETNHRYQRSKDRKSQ